MDTSNDKMKTPGHSSGQVKSDNLRKTGSGAPAEKGKTGLGSQETPRKFGQNPQGGINKPLHK